MYIKLFFVDKHEVEDSTPSRTHSIPNTHAKVTSLNEVPARSYLEVKGHINTDIEKPASKVTTIAEFQEKSTNVEVWASSESTVDNVVPKETSVSCFREASSVEVRKPEQTDIEQVVSKEVSVSSYREASSLEVKKQEHNEIDNVIAKETSLTDFDNPSSLEVKSEERSDIELCSELDSSITPHIQSHGELEEYKETSSVPSKAVKKAFEPLYHLARYVNESETLSNLVKLGVSLAEIEKKVGAADIIVKLNFEKDVTPVLMFLKDLAIDDNDIGRVLTNNPYIFKIDLDDLTVSIFKHSFF